MLTSIYNAESKAQDSTFNRHYIQSTFGINSYQSSLIANPIDQNNTLSFGYRFGYKNIQNVRLGLNLASHLDRNNISLVEVGLEFADDHKSRRLGVFPQLYCGRLHGAIDSRQLSTNFAKFGIVVITKISRENLHLFAQFDLVKYLPSNFLTFGSHAGIGLRYGFLE